MKICKNCNSKYEIGSFCPACGNKLVDEEEISKTNQQNQELPPEFREKPSLKPFIIMGVVVILVFLVVGVVFMQQHAKNAKSNVNNNTVATSGDNAAEGVTGQEEGNRVDEVSTEDQTPVVEVTEEEEVQDEKAKEETVKEEKKKTSTYKYVKDDISWKDAKKAAKDAGGHLATITSEAEYKKVAKVASESGLTFIWLGARVGSDESWSDAQWITGEEWSFKKWFPGEPSYVDADGTEELYLCFWNVKHDGEKMGWTFNDQRNDIAGAFPEFRGKIGYIIEFEE